MTAGLQAGVVANQSRPNFDMKKIVKEKKELMEKGELPPNPAADEMKDLWTKLNKIEAKEKCLRVQFLDWLSDKLLNWSNRVHVMSANIDSPCLIEVAPRKKEDSTHYKESKELARLKQLIKEKDEVNNNLRKANADLSDRVSTSWTETTKEIKNDKSNSLE